MFIGVPKEIKNNEHRVAMTPAGVNVLIRAGHEVGVQTGAGTGSGIADEEYVSAGAKVMDTPRAIYSRADIIVKVKEPLEVEYDLFREGQILYTYLHLAADKPLAEMLMRSKVTAIAYETIQLPDGSLPLLTPMSEVAGRMAAQIGAEFMQKYKGGMGILIGGVPGVLPANVLVVGAGVVGVNAARIAVGMGANVTIADINKHKLMRIDDQFEGRIKTLLSDDYSIAQLLKQTDLLIGAVLIPGAKAPKVIKEYMVADMKKGAVIVDVAIDQGGCVETIDRVTTHDNPCFEKHGVIHYSVANMPGAVPRTSTYALTGVTLPYLLNIANKGPVAAMKADRALMMGLNVYGGFITYSAISEDLDLPYKSFDDFM